MRGTFTAGVLEAFAEKADDEGAPYDFVVACSAGACNAASFLAGQTWRNRRLYLDFLDGNKLVRWSRLFTGGDFMDIDYLIDDVTVKLCPLDLDALRSVRRALESRYLRYREAAEIIARPPEGVVVRVVRPSRSLGVSRTTSDRAKLEQACNLGYEDGLEFLLEKRSC